MIKLSLNSPDVSKQQTPAPFAGTLAAAVEAAGVQPAQITVAQTAVKDQQKQLQAQMPSDGLLSRGVRWMQQKGRSKKRMQMIETVSLGEKRFVALVKVDGREFLLGGAPSSVGMLADLGAHGLGDLLSLKTPSGLNAGEIPSPAQPASEQPIAVTTARVHQPVQIAVPEVSIPEPMTPPLSNQAVEAATQAVPVELARVNVVVEAEEDESDWLVQDDLDAMFSPVVRTAPSIVPKSSAKVVGIHPEPAALKVAETVEQPAPVAVAATKPVASISSAAFSNANFTFQMWPAVPTAATTLVPRSIVPTIAAPKPKTGIDLESCPELLGEPYLLALVQKTRGAAA